MFRRLAIGLVLALLVALPATAQDYAKGWAAYGRGDYATALKEWQPLAEQGNAQAQYILGAMYAKGQGVPQDYGEALKWYHKAAAQGHANAQSNLGLMYSKGQGVPQDFAAAVKWYRKAVKQGYAPALYHLGVMYEKGQGVRQDYVEAAKWYGKAAAQGDADAYNNYAWLLATNKDPKFRDGEKAVALALKAVLPKRKSHYLDTLAAAYAEAGKFDEAIRVQKEAVDMLRISGSKPQLVKNFQERLNFYKSRKPYRD